MAADSLKGRRQHPRSALAQGWLRKDGFDLPALCPLLDLANHADDAPPGAAPRLYGAKSGGIFGKATAAVVELVRTTSQEQLSRERMRSLGVVEQATAEKAALEASHTEQAEVLQRMLNGARHMTPHLTPRDSRYRCCSG